MSNRHTISQADKAKGELSDEIKEAFERYARFCMPFVLIYWYWVCLPNMLDQAADFRKTTGENVRQT